MITRRIIGQRGPKYSAMPRAWRKVCSSSPSRRAPAQTTPIPEKAPEAWYSGAVAINAAPARSAVS